MEEIWKDIPGYEGKYQASSLGRIRSLDRIIERSDGKPLPHRGRVLHSYRKNSTGHRALLLGSSRIPCSVHRLVALAFLGPCPEGCEILHTNGDAADNRIENLRYDSHRENFKDIYRQGGRIRTLRLRDVEEIRFGLACGITVRELSQMYGVGDRMIRKIRGRERYGWLE